MSWDLRVENSEETVLITIRTINSRLWFVNNPKFDEKVLTYLARYQEMYNVILYAFIVMGNHYHLIARFPRANRAIFAKDFNARFSGVLQATVEGFRGGKVWARPYRAQALPNPEDVENWFFYCALNPISSGLVTKIGDYKSYNSFVDAVSGRVRKFPYVDWTEYNNRRRSNPQADISECTYIHELTFTRLPGYESMSNEEYRKRMFGELETRRQAIIKEKCQSGFEFPAIDLIKRTRPGAYPRHTKTSSRESHRPLVLTLCPETRRIYLFNYFAIVDAHRKSSNRFRNGELGVDFPPGTYRPPTFALSKT